MQNHKMQADYEDKKTTQMDKKKLQDAKLENAN